MKKSAHSIPMHPATHRECDHPAYSGEVKPEAVYDSPVGRVRTSKERLHNPLPLIEKIEKMPAKGVSKHKRMAAGRE